MHKFHRGYSCSSVKGVKKDTRGVLPFASLLLLSMPKAYFSCKNMDLLSAGHLSWILLFCGRIIFVSTP